MRNMVQDVPQLNLALPVVETYSYLLQLARASSNQRMSSPVERFLDLTDSEDSLQSLDSHYKVFCAVKKYQLDKLSGRMLSPKFAAKYPSLDVTNSESKRMAIINAPDIADVNSCNPLASCDFWVV
jgi:hypothetical protein